MQQLIKKSKKKKLRLQRFKRTRLRKIRMKKTLSQMQQQQLMKRRKKCNSKMSLQMIVWKAISILRRQSLTRNRQLNSYAA